jgi:kelch-like protein 20
MRQWNDLMTFNIALSFSTANLNALVAFRYDPQTNQWSCDVAPTTSCRTSVGVAVLEGFLYAVGGQDGVQCLNHVERYDPKENKWSKVAPMTTRRLGVAVAVLGGYLYAIGGSDGQCPLNTGKKRKMFSTSWLFFTIFLSVMMISR